VRKILFAAHQFNGTAAN
jgi:hypothetical protein